jgi:serine/threonine protein phosphatase PrpC
MEFPSLDSMRKEVLKNTPNKHNSGEWDDTVKFKSPEEEEEEIMEHRYAWAEQVGNKMLVKLKDAVKQKLQEQLATTNHSDQLGDMVWISENFLSIGKYETASSAEYSREDLENMQANTIKLSELELNDIRNDFISEDLLELNYFDVLRQYLDLKLDKIFPVVKIDHRYNQNPETSTLRLGVLVCPSTATEEATMRYITKKKRDLADLANTLDTASTALLSEAEKKVYEARKKAYADSRAKTVFIGRTESEYEQPHAEPNDTPSQIEKSEQEEVYHTETVAYTNPANRPEKPEGYNEDAVIQGDGFVGVFDGVGGGGSPYYAQIFAKEMQQYIERSTRDNGAESVSLMDALRVADTAVDRSIVGATCGAVVRTMGDTGRAEYVNFGDTVIYTVDLEGKFTKITRPVTQLNELVTKNILTVDELHYLQDLFDTESTAESFMAKFRSRGLEQKFSRAHIAVPPKFVHLYQIWDFLADCGFNHNFPVGQLGQNSPLKEALKRGLVESGVFSIDNVADVLVFSDGVTDNLTLEQMQRAYKRSLQSNSVNNTAGDFLKLAHELSLDPHQYQRAKEDDISAAVMRIAR